MRLDTAPESGENHLDTPQVDLRTRPPWCQQTTSAPPLLALLVVVDLVLVCTRTFSLYATVAALVSSGFIGLAYGLPRL